MKMRGFIFYIFIYICIKNKIFTTMSTNILALYKLKFILLTTYSNIIHIMKQIFYTIGGVLFIRIHYIYFNK